jgi:hypothetical protein
MPVATVAVLLRLGGFVMQRVAPHADSIGDVFRRTAS